jgi:AcrR family transcriptional regulator
MSNPLFDTLFRPTTMTPTIASAPPVRAPGVRSRAGNAMSRTRSALMSGAGRAVEVSGTKITMAQVAAAAGVAKATLYNHFRTREAVLDALLAAEVDALIDKFVGLPLEESLAGAAAAISKHPLRRTLALLEPQTLAAIGRIDEGAEPWHKASEAVEDMLSAHSRGGADFVLRWLASYLLTPASNREIHSDLALLLAALPVIPEPVVPSTPPGYDDED